MRQGFDIDLRAANRVRRKRERYMYYFQDIAVRPGTQLRQSEVVKRHAQSPPFISSARTSSCPGTNSVMHPGLIRIACARILRVRVAQNAIGTKYEARNACVVQVPMKTPSRLSGAGPRCARTSIGADLQSFKVGKLNEG